MPGSSTKDLDRWPKNVGILAVEVYFPSQYVDQSELEQFDGASTGKYTIGLGQTRMGFCSDREDINSLCLTVTQNLMERQGLSYTEIGRLEVGTETIIDKSKSVKTVLMQLFDDCGNYDMEGVDTTNACYGGTAALFNAVNWVESSSWDGRYALVVAGDIAVYATGNARPTGGAGAVALLVGPNAPLAFDRGLRTSHMQHVYDFYKPDMWSEYAVVDGKLPIQCYLGALDKCYQRYCAKYAAKSGGESFSLSKGDAFLFHSPYCKLVQKSFARLLLNDFLQDPNPDFTEKYPGMEALKHIRLEDKFFDKDVEKAVMAASNKAFQVKTQPSLLLASQVGNTYTPSLYGGLVSLLHVLQSQSVADITGKRVVLFSYGSGLASSMFSLHFSEDATDQMMAMLLSGAADIQQRLDSRRKVSPQVFADTLKLKEDTHQLAPYTPTGDTSNLFPGTWYNTHIDERYRRKYERKSSTYLPECASAAPVLEQLNRTTSIGVSGSENLVPAQH